MLSETLRAAVVGLILLSTAVAAAQYDPATEWRTMVSPHFHVHYPLGSYNTALDAARACETALDELSERLGWMPETPLHVLVNDETDSANGFAASIPYNLIGLNAVAPPEVGDLSFYDDFMYDLVVHELAHIVHFDTVRGIPSVINLIFGRLLTPNGWQPRWLVEGVATYFESALTGAGRVRSAFFDMYVRMAVLEGAELGIDEVTGFPWAWPQGSVPYLYGGRFVDFVVRRYGEDVLREISHDYGGRLMPFAINASLREATGAGYPELYEEFIAEQRARFEAQRDEVEQAGRREGERLTDRGQEIGRPRIARDGTVYFVQAPLGAHAVLSAIGPDRTLRDVGRLYRGADIALLPDGEHAIVSQAEVTDTYRFYGDLFRMDLTSGDLERLTAGARAHGVDISADGRQVIFAQNDGNHSVVTVARIDALDAGRVVADLGPRTQVWSPRFSPDGTSVVFAGFAASRRDIYRVDVATGIVEPLTSDPAVDGGPVYSPDGERVYFHSDRDGIFNLYTMPAAGGEIRRVTRVLGGAFHPEPTPDGSALLYRTYGVKGFDLARIPVGPLDGPAVADTSPGSRVEPIVRTRTEVYPTRDYSPATTVLPRAWLPEFTVDTRGSAVGVGVYGVDAVGLHSYGLSVRYGLSSGFAGFAATYVNRQFYPGLFVVLDRSLGWALLPYVRNGRPYGVEEEIYNGRLGTTWPLWSERELSVSLTTSYNLTYRRGTRALTFEPLDTTPRFPDQGRFASVRFGLAVSNVRSYTGSISAEEGTRLQLNLRVEDPAVGSLYSAVSGTARVTQYLPNPFEKRHVLALALTAGYGKSSYERRRLFAIGGLPRNDLILDILGGRLGSPQALRGFPVSPLFVGNALVVVHAEYRLPLYDVEAGVETLPIYLRTLHSAFFVDGAAIADSASELADARHFSAGMEVRLGLVLLYGLPTTVRLGYGHGLGKDDVQSVFLVLGGIY